ncbi:hypothetical protein HELRODRAFT_178165 [Helobdella robusta]|uniref:Uncharacterized protein n=1 Tax=Helobdella robusta TaxID=6412 RepID=T1FCV3_HELRO|nr:hypothetical protein HELRODRAFT_178165 [Helobdella robusta]ESN97374.1 hypothetical protein HELRODRAFT_178165 [Helobdella robusta]
MEQHIKCGTAARASASVRNIVNSNLEKCASDDKNRTYCDVEAVGLWDCSVICNLELLNDSVVLLLLQQPEAPVLNTEALWPIGVPQHNIIYSVALEPLNFAVVRQQKCHKISAALFGWTSCDLTGMVKQPVLTVMQRPSSNADVSAYHKKEL